MAKNVIDVSPDKVGWTTLVFDNYSNNKIDSYLSTLYSQIFNSKQYFYFASSYNIEDKLTLHQLLEDMKISIQEGALEWNDGKYLFIFYENICELSEIRLNNLLCFYDLARKTLNHQDKPIEAHLFCISNEDQEISKKEQAYINMLHTLTRISNGGYSSRLKLYLIVCPSFITTELCLESSVRWVYLGSRERRPEIFNDQNSDGLFYNLTYTPFHIEGCRYNRELIKTISQRLEGDKKEHTEQIFLNNFEQIIDKYLQNFGFDMNDLICGLPIPKEAIANIFTLFFKRTKLQESLAYLEMALIDTHLHAVHIPYVDNTPSRLQYLDEQDLLKALFENISPVYAFEKGEHLIKSLQNRYKTKQNSQDYRRKLRPRLSWKRLKLDIYDFFSVLTESSRKQVPISLIDRLMNAFKQHRSYFQEIEKKYREQLIEARKLLVEMGGLDFDNEYSFIYNAEKITKDRVSIHNTGFLQSHNLVIINNNIKRNWNNYKSGVDYDSIYFLGDSEYNILQYFYILEFTDVEKRMFRLEE